MFCENCGGKIAANEARFCPHCGHPVTRTEPERGGTRGMIVTDNGGGKAPAHFLEKIRTAPASLSRAQKAIIGGVAGVAVVAILVVLVIGLIPSIGGGKEPVLMVESGALIYYDGLSDEEGIVLDMDYGELDSYDGHEASATAYISSQAQFSEDGNSLFYPTGEANSGDTYDLMHADLKKAKKDKHYTAKLVASDVMSFAVVGDTVVYSQMETDRTGNGTDYNYPIGYYSISEETSVQIADDFSNNLKYGVWYVSADGKYILYGEDEALYFHDTTTGRSKCIAADAYVTYCTSDLTEIVYSVDDDVYLATTDEGEIVGTENLFTVPLDDVYVESANESYVCFSGEDSSGDYVNGIYKDGITTTYDTYGTVTTIRPLGVNVKSSDKNVMTKYGKEDVWGYRVDYENNEFYIMGSDMEFFKSSADGGIGGFAWDSDNEIMYITVSDYDDGDGYSCDLYAYTFEEGSVVDEKLIATGCADRLYYDSGSRALFYYDDYDAENSEGTLCMVYCGEFQSEILENAYVGYWSECGLYFNSANSCVLCWADADGVTGTLYALDTDAPIIASQLGTKVNMRSWGVYDDDIVFIGNYSTKNGGTLFSYDGKEITRERENVMAVITDSNRYTYLPYF